MPSLLQQPKGLRNLMPQLEFLTRYKLMPRINFCLIFLIVILLINIASAILFKSPRINVISAASIATSVPVPIAIPMFAVARAGASFIPVSNHRYFLTICLQFFSLLLLFLLAILLQLRDQYQLAFAIA